MQKSHPGSGLNARIRNVSSVTFDKSLTPAGDIFKNYYSHSCLFEEQVVSNPACMVSFAYYHSALHSFCMTPGMSIC